MKKLQQKFLWCASGFILVFPSAGFSASVSPTSQPLFLDSSVKHNIMLSIDDSGSMDWEVLFDNLKSDLYLDSDGNFIKNGVYSTSGYRYGYLFPNGYSDHYYTSTTKAGMMTNWGAVPPLRPYAFARSPDFNKSYYDPNVTYEPWPIYGGKLVGPDSTEYTTFGPASTSATRFDPLVSRTMKLFEDFTPPLADYSWQFYLSDNDMVCDNAGNSGSSCSSANIANYSDGSRYYRGSYYPATYYLKNTASSYTYDSSGGGGSVISPDYSQLFEAENYISEGSEFKKGTTLNSAGDMSASTYYSFSYISSDASYGNFIGVSNVSSSSPPRADSLPSVSTGEAVFDINLTGKVYIWIRRWFPSGNDDSVWLSIDGYGSSAIDALNNNGRWGTYGGQEWNGWIDSHSTSTSWVWEKWAVADLPASGVKKLRMRYRENRAFIDQVLVTTDSTITPAGQVVLSSSATKSYSCGDAIPSRYDEFVRKPGVYKFPAGSNIVALAPDGTCLEEYKITGTDTNVFANGATNTARTGVTVAQEKQNFANWFKYYRRRHQATRGAIGHSFQSIDGIRSGLFWINNQRSVSMFDMDKGTDVIGFLKDNYLHVGEGGTPLRDALHHAGSEYKKAGTITLQCQKNFTLLFTDGFNNNTLDEDIKNVDGTDKAAGAGNISYKAAAPFKDTNSNTLSDVSMLFYNSILRTDIPAGKVKTSSDCDLATHDSWLDCNPNLHMNTYTVGLGALGSSVYGKPRSDGGTYLKVKDAHNHHPTWPTITNDEDSTQVDDLYHAAVNGRGEMFNAQNPAALSVVLESALKDILSVIGSAATVTFNTASLKEESAVYSASFNSSAWTGDLHALDLDAKGNVLPYDADDPDYQGWSAESILRARIEKIYDDSIDDSEKDGRNIFTYSNNKTVRFDYDNLTATQKADFDVPDSSGTTAQDKVEYIKGKDISGLRSRSKSMGDIINSSPVYVGKPAQNYPDKDPFGEDLAGKRYSDFETAQKNRRAVVYVGSNDGMIHGFNANPRTDKDDSSTIIDDRGREVMAYIPNLIYSTTANSGLHYLTDPNYTHRYYVDQTPIAADVYFDGKWRTILVGGLRTGGKGIFALDVTTPDLFEAEQPAASSTTTPEYESLVLWEFDGGDDMGQQISTPIVAKMNSGDSDSWAVIFGNGFNSKSNTTKLYIVNVEPNSDHSVKFKTIDTQFTSSSTGGLTGGLSGVAVADVDGNGTADRIFAGDLNGNMWVFDVSSSNEGDWAVANKSGSSPAPLFTAKNSAGKVQPITAAPNLAFHPEKDGSDNLLVSFGTGKYLESGDPTNTDVQSVYVVWDKAKSSKSLTRSDLAPVYIEQSTTSVTVKDADGKDVTKTIDVRKTTEIKPGSVPKTGALVDWSSQSGWYMDFDAKTSTGADVATENGERLIVRPSIRNGFLVFNTLVPESDECGAGGHSWLMAMPLANGMTPSEPVFDLNNDGIVDSKDALVSGMGGFDAIVGSLNILGDNIYMSPSRTSSSGDGGSLTPIKVGADFGKSAEEGRIGWRELIPD
ncbi:hypothetical protein EUZ85_28070 [Hahella sp. KA22]|uniref:pilus assembly protein n=1 Tax=Hahella sp. KA22 TaxID=1628392 RepID=UPI000FDEBFE5|nr:PilC/PilY family type IV pilus protein [Hahella sp. KA22]AZZ94360.1 hypothetical protein ENC22_25485 [Hahella sp. KA22]QAY57734.1 hypothetical protein EUZ85_28070 [Hahella sp. KA22]